MTHFRSILFVPGNRPDRFEKACRSGADLVCIDLEDAVAPNDKATARQSAISWLEKTTYLNVSLRINASSGMNNHVYKADVKALQDSHLTRLPFIMLPKVNSYENLDDLASRISQNNTPLFPIIESASGLINCENILAHKRVKFTLYGAIDLAGDTGMDQSWESHLYGRSRLSTAAAAYGVTLFDVPYLDIKDADGCAAEARRAKSLGIFAKSAIHPSQIAAIHDGLRPNEAELAEARHIVSAFEASDGNVTLLDGKMLEAPVFKAAQRVIALAE